MLLDRQGLHRIAALVGAALDTILSVTKMAESKPLIIAVLSGRGGVGKTMLAVAVAKELSLQERTLIVDLDFFNRGLSGLMKKGTLAGYVDKPSFFDWNDSREKTRWQLLEVAESILHVSYPEVSK